MREKKLNKRWRDISFQQKQIVSKGYNKEYKQNIKKVNLKTY